MPVNKKYQYRVVRGTDSSDMVEQMNKLGELGWRFVATTMNSTGVIMELEGVRTDKTTGAYWWPTYNEEGNKKRAEFCRTMALKARSGLLREE